MWQKPIYTHKPGKSHHLVVENGKSDGTKRVTRWRVFVNGSRLCSSHGPRTVPEKKDWPIRLLPRTVVRIVLEGNANSYVRCWIEGQAIPETQQTIARPDESKFTMRGEPQEAPSAISLRMRPVYSQPPGAVTPLPKIDFVADQHAISIGQGVNLNWHVQDPGQTTLTYRTHLKLQTPVGRNFFLRGIRP